jgi:hypothetical protein
MLPDIDAVSRLCPGQNSKHRQDRVTVLWDLFTFISLVVSELCPGQCSKCKRAITPKLGNAELRFLCTAHLPNENYLPIQSYMLIPLVVSELCPGQKKRTDDYMLSLREALKKANKYSKWVSFGNCNMALKKM